MQYETKTGKIVNYPFIEDENQLLELAPSNKYENIVDYLTMRGETPRRVMNEVFGKAFGSRVTELNRAMTSMQVIEVDGIVRLQRAIKYNTTTLYQKMYPNSNGKRGKDGDFTGPKSYYKISLR